MTPAGVLTTLVNFTGNGGINRGAHPLGGLVRGSDANYYGTTSFGGTSGKGTVFKMSTDGTSPGTTLVTLVDFTGTTGTKKGFLSGADLVQGSDGNFYGTTQAGGTNDFGTVFKISLSGEFSTLVEFTNMGGSNRGRSSEGDLIQGNDGSFYGTTSSGGAFGSGTVFKMTPQGVLTTLVDFKGLGTSTTGAVPFAGLTQGSDGIFYGTTRDGGTNNEGTVFRMTVGGELTTLVNFTGTGGTHKGTSPQESLIQGNDGNFYGTTNSGGVTNEGTVFKMTPTGNLTTLVEFPDSNGLNTGNNPLGGLVQGSDGDFYGTTASGGANFNGTVFKIVTDGTSLGSTLTTLVDFTGMAGSKKGRSPTAGLVLGNNGFFYGTTTMGGANNLGTVFRMTATGTLTTLVEFTGNGASNKGDLPNAGLMLSNDGNFYGSTAGGGATNFGTVFKLTPDGVLTTLVEFTGTAGSRIGRRPYGDLVQGSDGSFYGTTLNGGGTNNGTIFKIVTTGTLPGTTLTTLAEFPSSTDGAPYGTIISATDGNFYGTTTGGDGAIYRLILPGTPLVTSVNASASRVDALLTAKFNARGAITAVQLEWGTDSGNLSNISPVTVNLDGFQSVVLGRQLSGLIPGATYFYRFRAASSAGTTFSQTRSFATLAQPIALTDPASNILPTSVRFNGTVNAQNSNTSVLFEWGSDGNSFPNQVPASGVTGNAAVSVSAPVAGLTPGVIYYYRIVASNAGGTVTSGTQSFRTLTAPTAALTDPIAITSQSATLNGTVNAEGSPAAVIFEYGTDGTTFPFSVGATPSTVTGEINTPVSANLSGLAQGATYHYRIKATSAGGVGVSNSDSLALDILSGFTQVFPSAPLEAQGFVLVNLTPSGVGGWRFTGEQQWRSSGIPVGALTTGDRSIEFRPVQGYIQPSSEIVSIISGGAATLIDRVYYDTPTSGSGGLSVSLKPAALASASVPEADRAQWRFSGEDDTQWRDSDTSLTGLLPGNYLIECKPVAGRTTPPTSAVLVQDLQTAVSTLTYFLADSLTGTPPSPIPFETVSSDISQPYAHVGQIRSNVGSSSGFVVKQRVIATAGHVVFDDGTLSAVTGLQWLFQRHRGTYEPKPQIPRGYYIFDGYAAQRASENTPGSSSPQSQNLDVAALYFPEDAGRTGYSGFLASDALDNEFLLSPAQKILVGYPVDGITPTNQGRMHATPTSNVVFTRAFGRTYNTTSIRSTGGMSGGPLCVQFENGNYYPAAIYLGGTGQTVVRSIDSQVIELFNRAEVSGNGGSNNTGGGITHTGITTFGATADPGSIRITILPATAAITGRWGLRGEPSNRSSGNTSSGRAVGDYILQFTSISGFQVPAPQTVRINGGQLSEITFTYAADTPPPTITSANSVNGTRGQPLNYQIVANQSPISYLLTGTLPTGLAFDTSNGLLNGTLQQAGVFIFTLGATNAGGTGTKVLVLTSRPSVSNQSATTILGQPMSQQIASSESGTDLSYTASDLPPGTLLDEATGLVTGSPSLAGVFNSLFTVTKNGASASAILTLTVTANPLDAWRQANFQTTSNTGDAADGFDPDKDGQTNLSEYAAGTNPNSSTDVFRILTSTKNATTFTVVADGKAARSYVLERSTDLHPVTWTTVQSIGPLAGNGPVVLTDPDSPNNSAFYRLKVSAP